MNITIIVIIRFIFNNFVLHFMEFFFSIFEVSSFSFIEYHCSLSVFRNYMPLLYPSYDERGSLHGTVANMLNCDIILSVFELLLGYYVHFRMNNLILLGL